MHIIRRCLIDAKGKGSGVFSFKPMAKVRQVNTFFWDDSYIEELNPNAKLLFIYLITSPLTNIAGSFEISLKKICDHTGLSRSKVEEILEKFAADDKFIYRENWMLAVNAIGHQDFNNPKIQKGIEIIISASPVWAIDRVCIAYSWLSHLQNRASHLNLNPNSNPKGEEPPPEDEEKPISSNPALVLYEETFGAAGTKFAKQIVSTVTDFNTWQKVVRDKSAFADDPKKLKGVPSWILQAYDERIAQKRKEPRLPTPAEKQAEYDSHKHERIEPPEVRFVSGVPISRQDN